MKFEPVSLKHGNLLNSLWKPLCEEYGLQFAEYSFANIFLFRRQHHYELMPSEVPLVRGRSQTGFYLIPTQRPESLNLDILEACGGKDAYFFPIPDKWIAKGTDENLRLSYSRDDSDYIYRKEKLKNLRGRALSSRRNLLHQLNEQHKITSKILTKNEIGEAKAVLEEWQKQSKQLKEKTDYYPCQDAFDHMNDLSLFGRIAYADGIPIGFTIGENLSSNTALLHISKSLREYKGATAFLYQDFVKYLPDAILWVNLEQDLGLLPLRRAKLAYEPDVLLTKWRLRGCLEHSI